MDAWLVLIAGFPPRPSSLRVRAWRKLRALGAVALKNSVYLLPFSPENYEQFQWLAQEIQRGGGEVTLLKVDRIENMQPLEVIRRFQVARSRDYAALATRYRTLLRGLGRRPTRQIPARVENELVRLAKEVKRVREIDFFGAPGFEEVRRLQEAVAMRRHPPSREAGADDAATQLDALRGRRWVTRPRPHVDRIASAWLIKRFLDADAEFLFASPNEFPPGAIPFDVPGAEFGHQGEDCTFETLLKRSGLHDPRLTALAEIVHEVDLRDGKFPRDEAAGVGAAIRGLMATLKDDHELLAQGLRLFDALHAALDSEA
ncbi:MAG: chromate resistance protein [Candidatus Rokubacteria bacterium]|nr:chromate resistance protein [Candidatus Rokubacteria bacterium]